MNRLLFLAALFVSGALFAQTTVTPASTTVTPPPVTVTPPAVTATSPPLTVTFSGSNVVITGGNPSPLSIPIPTTPTCPALPPTLITTQQCPTGTTGTWQQTTTYSPAAYPTCWTSTTTPTSPPAGSCPTTPPSGITWVYQNGKMNWGGDWSFAATINYKDTAGIPLEGPYDIAVTIQQWGGWQPYVNGSCQSTPSLCFNTTPYTYLIFSVKSTIANLKLKADMLSEGDTADGVGLTDLGPYCSGGDTAPVGVWESCKVPLAAFKLTNPVILKFAIGDETGLSSNLWYLDDVGFQ